MRKSGQVSDTTGSTGSPAGPGESAPGPAERGPTERGPGESEPAGGGRTPRRWLWVLPIVVLVGLYAALITAYAVNTGSGIDQPETQIPAGGVGVILTARAINAVTPEMDVDVQLALDPSLVDDAGVPTQPLTLTLGPTQEDADLTYDTDHRPQVRQVKIMFDGDIEDWPFDDYQSSVYAQVSLGEGSNQQDVPTVLIVDGAVESWQLAAAADPDEPELFLDITFHRSLAIILFGLTLVLVLVLLPVTCWIVGLKLLREDRLFEAGFLGWIAAMLFATIPIRNFFPGSPPPGSWVDVLVTLWVIVALTLALVIGLAAFVRHPRRNH